MTLKSSSAQQHGFNRDGAGCPLPHAPNADRDMWVHLLHSAYTTVIVGDPSLGLSELSACLPSQSSWQLSTSEKKKKNKL